MTARPKTWSDPYYLASATGATMETPIELETILGEFDSDYEAWVLQDASSGLYVVVPDKSYPGRRPVRFFMKSDDAATLLAELLKVNPALRGKAIQPVKVKLHTAIRGIASDRTPGNADSFVFHGPNEVLHWAWDQAAR